ncbi:hypothetical protein [Escherichia coli]|uniref:hypothetical protein n=1 Tax=Escherichia coli TaxID=562 RepID=UPI001FCE86E0|nr:hypothetical protein [Escherichia coli]
MAETLTRKEWIDSLTNSGMRADKARFAVDDGIKNGSLKRPATASLPWRVFALSVPF